MKFTNALNLQCYIRSLTIKYVCKMTMVNSSFDNWPFKKFIHFMFICHVKISSLIWPSDFCFFTFFSTKNQFGYFNFLQLCMWNIKKKLSLNKKLKHLILYFLEWAKLSYNTIEARWHIGMSSASCTGDCDSHRFKSW